ncbi:MAG: hypothetical protein WDM87_15735 [Terracidiphilus sp.]
MRWRKAIRFRTNFAGLLDVSSALLKEEPESKQAFLYNIEALMGLSRYDDAMAQADARLKLLDNDSDAYSAKMQIEANRGDFAAAHAWGEKLLALGQEKCGDVEWTGMGCAVYGQGDGRRHRNGREGHAIAKRCAGHSAHAGVPVCGDGKDEGSARLLLRAMDDWNLDEPNDESGMCWGALPSSTASGILRLPTTAR